MLSFMGAIAPARLTVDFSPIDAFSAVVGLALVQDNQLAHSHLTVIHCSLAGDEVREGSGEATEVYEGEALICIVRRVGAIVASGVFEVNCSVYGRTEGAILIPRCSSNLIVTQTCRDVPTPPQTTPLAEQVQG